MNAVIEMEAPGSCSRGFVRNRIFPTFGNLEGWASMFSLLALLFCACGDANDLSEEIPPGAPVQVVLSVESHPNGWGLTVEQQERVCG